MQNVYRLQGTYPTTPRAPSYNKEGRFPDNLKVIITGDSNFDCLNSTLQQTARTEEFLMANELIEMITKPTRVTITSSPLIHFLLTSTPSSFESAGVLSSSCSDHLPIFGVLHGPSSNMLNTVSSISTRLLNTQNADHDEEARSVP